MKRFAFVVGIDVSKDSLDVCMITDPTADKHYYSRVTNDKKGVQDIYKQMKRIGIDPDSTLFCFEHTGIYSTSLCYQLHLKQANYSVVPAIEIKRSKGLTRGKNDKADAKDIAYYAITHQHKLQLSELPEDDLAKLKLLLSERDKLIKSISIFERTKEGEGYLPKSVFKEVLVINTKTISFLRKRLSEIDHALLSVVKANSVIKEQYDLACSVPGVGTQTALHLIVTTRCFKSFEHWRKLACYAGIAPFEYTSGSSIRGRTKVSHMANKKLKSLLNMAALSAKKYDVQIRQYYEKKRSEGKNAMLVMNAIRCKVVSRVFATVKRGTPYVEIARYAA